MWWCGQGLVMKWESHSATESKPIEMSSWIFHGILLCLQLAPYSSPVSIYIWEQVAARSLSHIHWRLDLQSLDEESGRTNPVHFFSQCLPSEGGLGWSGELMNTGVGGVLFRSISISQLSISRSLSFLLIDCRRSFPFVVVNMDDEKHVASSRKI